jgi:NDP-sugar pyrophosphorylase family protein
VQAKIRTALVLAGGKGERLRPLTDDRPKPMVLVGDGRPLIDYHLRWLAGHGVQRAILLVGYRQDVIRDYFSVARIPGLTVECVGEDKPLGRGGAIRNGFEQAGVQDELVMATNGDVVSEQPLAPMLALHRETRALATVLLTKMVSPFGVVELNDASFITSFREKPVLPFWINAGAYILSREALLRFPREGDHETLLFPQLAQEGRIAGFKSDAYWKSVESAKDLRELSERVAPEPPETLKK